MNVRQFMQLATMAFACDLTRVITFCAPVPLTPVLGYPASDTFHEYAHESIDGATACGQTYSPLAQQAITDLDAWHAGHFAYLLEQLDSVKEGSGTLLDSTAVVWIPELGTPTHLHNDLLLLLAGGCNGFFKTGQYVRYPRTLKPAPGHAHDGPRPQPAPCEPLAGDGAAGHELRPHPGDGKRRLHHPAHRALTEIHA